MRAANTALADERDQAAKARTSLRRQLEHAEEAHRQTETQREEAEAARWEAVREREQAEKARWQAVREREQAEKGREEAVAGRLQAVKEREEAETARWQAIGDREAAERGRWQAISEREQAEARRWNAVKASEAADAARLAALQQVEMLKKQPQHAGLVAAQPAPAAPRPVLRIPKFWERNFWEPTVQFPIRDYCGPGDTVFDVGANAGGLSMLMSRLVGPRGIVCSFEASPRIIEMTNDNLVSAGCSNVQLYHRAIYHTSRESVAIYAGSHLNDSLYPAETSERSDYKIVETLALDDFVEATGLVPKLIKMDIEGAEFDALQGMKRLLARAKPILILEQSSSDMRCHAFLTDHGYAAVDLSNYRRIRSPADFERGSTVANVLFVHSSAKDDPYLDEAPPKSIARIPASAFERSAEGSFEPASALLLPPGRYLCRADFSASGTDNEIFAGIDIDGEVAIRYHTYTRFMADSYSDWVFAAQKDSQVSPYLRFVKGQDQTLDWRGVEILRFPQFAGRPRSIID